MLEGKPVRSYAVDITVELYIRHTCTRVCTYKGRREERAERGEKKERKRQARRTGREEKRRGKGRSEKKWGKKGGEKGEPL